MADLAITKVGNRSPIVAGNQIIYTLTITNNGPDVAENTILADTLPTEIQDQEYSLNQGGTWLPWGGSLNLGDLAAGETRIVLIRGNVALGTTGNLVNTAQVTSDTPDPNPDNNTSTVTTSVDSTLIPFTCEPIGIQVATSGPGTNSQLATLNLVTGELILINNDLGISYNAIGYNSLDNLIYGMNIANANLVAMGADGTLINYGAVPNLPSISYIVGDIDDQGRLYIYRENEDRYYVIDVDTNSPTFGQLLDPTAGFVLDTAPFGTALSQPINVADWSWSPVDNQLYAINRQGNVLRIDPTTGNVTVLTSTGLDGSGAAYGATFIDGTGILYGINNATGIVYRVIIDGDTAEGEAFSNALISSGNDGASCAQALIEVDFGDAPDQGPGNGPNNYSTLLANNGPRHQIINTLYLGTTVTGELDAYQNADATGDDLIEGIQDDGVAVPLPTLLVNDTTYELQVTVTNETNLPANLYGWIDFNRDGVFQGNESAAVVVVPSAPGTQEVTLNFTVPAGVVLEPSNTFVRLRLTTEELINLNANQNLEDTRSIGPARDGEVEDYILQIGGADLSITKAPNMSPLIAGEEAIYTLNVTNQGPANAENVVITDNVPLENPEYSLDQGVTWLVWTGSITIDELAAGETLEVSIRGTVASSAQESLVNTATVTSDTPDPNPEDNTTTIETPVETSADLNITKEASPIPLIAGEEGVYTITVTNEGPSDAKNVEVEDITPLEDAEYSLDGGTTWLLWEGSVVLGTLETGTTQIILIRGMVPSSVIDSLENTATVTSDTPDPNPEDNTTTIETPVETSADLNITKEASPIPLVAGEEGVYTITVTNEGPSDAKNVEVEDITPLEDTEYSLDGGTTWLLWEGSVVLGTLEAGTTQIILIRGIVPTSALEDVENTATVTSDTPDPNPEDNTTTIETPVETSADLSIVKASEPQSVRPGETIVYTLVIENNGPSDAQNVVLNDELPPFVLNPEYSLDEGATWQQWLGSITFETISAGSVVTLRIRGTVSEDAVGELINTAVIVSETPDPNPDTNTSTNISLVSRLDVTKSVSVIGAVVGDIIQYTIEVVNSGEVLAEAITVTDLLSPELQYANDLRLNGVPIEGNITEGVAIGDLNPGESAVLTFNVEVIGIPQDQTITNQAVVDYIYREDPEAPPIEATDESNEVDVTVFSPSLQVLKSSNRDAVEVGELFVYTIEVTNTGDIEIENNTIQDDLPPSFEVQSVKVNGVVVEGDLREGIVIGDLAIGETKVIEVEVIINETVDTGTFINESIVTGEVIVDPNMPPKEVTETGTDEPGLIIYNPQLVLEKRADREYAVVGDIITYTLEATNKGNVNLNNVAFETVNLFDSLPSQLAFVAGSVTLDGVVLPQANILAGIPIGSLLVDQTKTLTFQVEVLSGEITPITNTATGVYTYDLPGRPQQSNTAKSNENVLNVSIAKIEVIKTANKETVNLEETISYTIELINTGNLTAYNVLFTDTLPEQVVLVPGSFKINNQVVNGVELDKGIIVPVIEPGETITLTYEVEVIGTKCNSLIINQAQVVFEYRFPDGSGGTLTETGESSTATVEINLTTFKQMSIETYLHIPEVKPNIENINEATGTIEISGCHVIQTPTVVSTEGQRLTGHKLIVKGVLNLVIEYTALEETQSVHSAHYSIPFSAFVILPSNYVVGSKVEVIGLVEDIYYHAVDIRTFFTNVTALINVKILGC